MTSNIQSYVDSRYIVLVLGWCPDWGQWVVVSAHSSVTSVRYVWKQVHTGVVVICSDQPVGHRCVVFGFVTQVWACSTVISRVIWCWGSSPSSGVLVYVGSVVSDSGRRHSFFFLVGWEEKTEFKLCYFHCDFHVIPSNNLYFYII